MFGLVKYDLSQLVFAGILKMNSYSVNELSISNGFGNDKMCLSELRCSGVQPSQLGGSGFSRGSDHFKAWRSPGRQAESLK